MPNKNGTYKKTVLDGGVRVISEKMPGLRSVAIGLWVENGSRFETDSEAGISHFIEHMFFKGTEKRTSHDISREIESVGGMLNAFTSREYTCYYCKVVDEHLGRAVDLLSDMFLHSAYKEEDIEKERGVIIQEIKMYEDTPDDYVHDIFYNCMFNDHPLGRPVIGSVDTVKSFKRKNFLDYLERQYHPQRVIVAAAGNVDHEQLVEMVAKELAVSKPALPEAEKHEYKPIKQKEIFNKDSEQAHIVLGMRGPHYTDLDRHPYFCMNIELGHGMSSRLFQEVREKRGLVYSIHSWLSMYRDNGFLGVYAGTSPEKAQEVVDLVALEIKKIRNEPLTETQLSEGKEQIRGNLLISAESTDNRMTRLARNEIYFGEFIPYETVLADLDRVTVNGVQETVQRRFDFDQVVLAVVGPLEDDDLNLDSFK
jgi:predicted Zn-dependent peptidase